MKSFNKLKISGKPYSTHKFFSGFISFTLILILGSCDFVFGQLQASFTVNLESGCKPLAVKFTNTTSGANSNTIYSWDLGNGNTSSLSNPGATYIEEKIYTITLTATQGNLTSTFNRQITVYKTPLVDFAASPNKGCMPLAVTFTSTVLPGDGSIAKYFWDFGDGDTASGSNVPAPKHTYTFAQQAPVSLTVTNSFGCVNSRTYGGMVEVYQLPMADFIMNPPGLCASGKPITFTNRSLLRNGTSWIWGFGDGNVSMNMSPVHQYVKDSTYQVTLKATAQNGCKDSITYQVSTTISLDLPVNVCESSIVELKHRVPDSFLSEKWFADGVVIPKDDSGKYKLLILNSDPVLIMVELDYGSCKATKTEKLIINPIVKKGMLQKKKLDACNIPTNFEIMDTTGIGVQWTWRINDNEPVLGNGAAQLFSYNDTMGIGYFKVNITSTQGCTSTIQDTVMYGLENRRYRLRVSNTAYTISSNICEKVPVFCSIESIFPYQNDIVKFEWDFGDGNTSTEPQPRISFAKAGLYQVSVKYETANGCKGILYHDKKVTVIEKPKATLEIEGGNLICGNNPVFINVISNSPLDYQSLQIHGDAIYDNLSGNWPYQNKSFYLKFRNEGTFSATFIYGDGGCFDTLHYNNFLTVKPPFTYPLAAINSCEGDRLTVGFTDTSKGATKWKWDFDDGTVKTFNSKQDTVYHKYSKSDYYTVRLTAINGTCEVTDSIEAIANVKPKPLLDLYNDSSCTGVPLSYIMKGYEENLDNHFLSPSVPYKINSIQFTDSTMATNFSQYGDILFGLSDPGKTGMRFFMEDLLGCLDTSNFAPVKLAGPKPDFKLQKDEFCINDFLVIKDSSRSFFGKKIIEWNWGLSVGNYIENFINTSRQDIIRKMNDAGQGNIYLRVVDEDGCESDMGVSFFVQGPKSFFKVSSETVAIGTTVNFTNQSNYTAFANATPKWILPDGSFSNKKNEQFTFNQEGVFFVKLLHTSPGNGCSDTMVVKITVRKVNAQFTHSISYVNNNGCPPAIVRFVSNSSNSSRYQWSFGNGGIGGNQASPTHTYTKPGIYEIWLYAYDENNNVDSSFDFIEIKGPYALISSNRLFSCNTLDVTLRAEVKNAKAYTWDFGDGTLSSEENTTVSHRYLTAGVYTPALLLEDETGCKAISVLPQKIIVDSLDIDFTYAPQRICAGSEVGFTGLYKSFSDDVLNAPLQFSWKIDNRVSGDKKDVKIKFAVQGTYQISYEVKSEYGCIETVRASLKIEPPIQARIEGLSSVCLGDTTSFRATALGDQITWRWNIPGQPVTNQSNTTPIKWTVPGVYLISLLADNGACTDSVVHLLSVNALPSIILGPANAYVCLGDTLTLSSQGTGQHSWAPVQTLKQVNNLEAKVWPATDTWYRIASVSEKGCRSEDSIRVQTILPIKLAAVQEVEACLGQTVLLSSSGATAYLWTPSAGLSNPNISNPQASPVATTTYKLVGKDAFGCFADSLPVKVTIHPIPIIDAGPNISIFGGESLTLNPSANLPIATWFWNPATYLSCWNCASPVSKPLQNIKYSVKATTSYGCSASDSIDITLLCSKENIFIPNAFTPNGDGLNEYFGVLGNGFSLIKVFRIIGRWGNIVFECRNQEPSSLLAKWNGMYPGGQLANSGTYIYMAQLECPGGNVFDFKGTVNLIR